MFKRTVSVLLLIFIFAAFSFSAYAEPFRVNDNAQLLNDDEVDELEEYLYEKRIEDFFDIVIVTETYVDDLESYADDFYDINGYGVGDDRDGVLLLVTDYGCWLSTCGIGIDAVDPYLSELSSDFHVDVEEGGYLYAFRRFSDSVSVCLNFERDKIENGYDEDEYDDYDYNDIILEDIDSELYNRNPASDSTLKRLITITVISLAAGFIGACLVVSSMKRKHISVRAKANANDFVIPGSFMLNAQSDHLVSRHVTKVAKPDDDTNNHNNMNNHSSGVGGFSGGGSTHVSSSGVTHGGGAF